MNQPIPYGYRPVHDLPTPPRSSPPVTVLDIPQKAFQQPQQHHSPPTKPMSAPHRGLPLPAAMTLAQPPPPHGPPHPSAPGSAIQAQPPPAPSPHSQSFASLPPPPQWQGSEDSMRNWLAAKAEEERRRQEEEKTRQESLRLEQRRIEHDILRTSLERGVPPPMIPIVFAGMSGGNLSQATLEWVQQFLPPPQQPHHAQILPAQGPTSPEHRRDSQQYGSYAGSAGVPPTPGSGTGAQAGFVPYQGPGSPTRPRAHTIGLGSTSGRSVGGLAVSALPKLSTGEGGGGPSHASHTAAQPQQQQQQGPATQQETQSPSLYFHYWQPPTSHASSSQPAASSDSPKKRKATGPQHAAPPPSQRRSRSPTFGQQASTSVISNPPPGRRRGHSRQRSDISAYRSTGRNRGEPFGPPGGFSPGVGNPVVGTSRETTFAEPYQQSRGSHSVSSLLSDQPSAPYAPNVRPSGQPLEGEQRSRATSEERGRGAQLPPPPPPPPSAARERTND
ncbi:hypothetical protein SAMD00023353_1302220 [Rosellinia necatrix]|uniref:Uncharacterized protein n=1 Tax=Rosellinia necatrix TaxID=77044 RepID=A0A1W2TC46_ROSNE|nr:hypothetical protein SAMD00023353_1302220 [Rosellinia necatrix]